MKTRTFTSSKNQLKIQISIYLTSIPLIFMSFTGLASEYSHTPVKAGNHNYANHLNTIRTPKVSLENKCDNNGENCWSIIKNHEGKLLKSFSRKDSVRKIATSRFSRIGYLAIHRSYPCGSNSCSQSMLMDSNGKSQEIQPHVVDNTLTTYISLNKDLLTISEKTVVLQHPSGNVIKQKETPEPMMDAFVGSNLKGDYTAIAIATSGRLYIGDGFEWTLLSIRLASRGDRKGIASIFPRTTDDGVIAIYRYINEYNKGLYLLSYASKSGGQKGGWLFNSEIQNIGFDPSIYYNLSNEIVVAAYNSSTDLPVFFTLTDQDMKKLPATLEKNEFNNEKTASFMLGSGISHLSWDAKSRVKKDGVTFTDIDYEISDTLFTSANLEAMFAGYSLSVNFLQNRTDGLIADEIDSGGNKTSRTLSKNASSYLFGTIDLPGMLSPSSSLRIQAEIGETVGIARVKSNDGSIRFKEFSTEKVRFAVLAIQERGFLIGADLVTYKMPSAIGFSNNAGTIVYSNFDPDFEFTSVRFLFGYDPLAYTKRYETNYHRPYMAGSGNIGLGWAEISDDVKTAALSTTGKAGISNDQVYFTLGFDIEAGYLWQRRSKRFHGLGYSFSAGYRANFSWLGAGSEGSDENTNDLFLEFERQDIMHGPYLKVNLIY